MAQRIEVARAGRITVPETASVQLAVPADKHYIVLVRSAVAQLGACFGFTMGDIGDLRLAVDEACNLLVAGGPDPAVSGLECRAVVRGDLLRVTLSASAVAAAPPDTEGFGWTILAALVDALAWEQSENVVRVEIEKRRGTRGG
ncbi:serine/threonine-protein kinase RsbW [Catenulispora sp. GP43]|uniref:ATP-binding protein n=1 Tax=Catenulispora sp. GP43 TaxID=3156263 RepID=UPI0035191FE8